MFENSVADIKKYYESYKEHGILKRIFYLVFTQQLYPVLIYRFGHWAECDCKIPIVGSLLRIVSFFLEKFSYIFLGTHIRLNSDIGPGLMLSAIGCQFVQGKIGKNCTIQQGVSIGWVGGFRGGGPPTLGDNVYVGAGAKVLGPVKVGNNVKIGANAVVITDIPDNAVAVGVPAVVKWSKR